jgi:hypothetical protein
MLTAACRETRAGRNAPKSVPTSTAEVMTQPIPSPAGTAGTATSQPAPIAEVEVMLAVGAPWGLDGAPRMPFEARRVTEVFGAMPMRLDGLGRVAAPAEHGDAPVLRYVDADGMSVVTIVPRLFPLQATAPEFVRRLAREFCLVAATGAVDVSDTARLVYVAGGFVGAEPPIHGFIWAYSDRGFAFVLTSTSAAARELVVRTLVESL